MGLNTKPFWPLLLKAPSINTEKDTFYKNILCLILALCGFNWGHTQTDAIEKHLRMLLDSAFVDMQGDRQYEAIQLIDSSISLAKLHNLPFYEGRAYKNKALAFVQLKAYKIAAENNKLAIKISKEVNDTLNLTSTYVNQLHCYMLDDDHKSYYALLDTIDSLKINPKDQLYNYETKLMFEFNQNDYKKVIALSDEALFILEESTPEVLFHSYKNKIAQLVYLRLKITFEMYQSFAKMELGIDVKNTYDKLTWFQNQKLEDILWYSVRIFENIDRINHYKYQYFTHYKVNKDSAAIYYSKLQKSNKKVYDFLTIESKRNSAFLIDNIKAAKELSDSKLQLEMRKNATKNFHLSLIFSIVILVILLLLITINHRNNRNKTRFNNQLQTKNKELHAEIINRKHLEEKIAHIAKEMNRDLHDTLGNKLAGIQNTNDILKELHAKKQTESNEYKSFLNHLDNNLKKLHLDLKDLIWFNSQENNSVDALALRLESILEAYDYLIPCDKIFIKNISTDYQLPKLWNRQIVVIFKDLLSLIAKNITYTNIHVELSSNINQIEIEINAQGEINLDFLKILKLTIQNLKNRVNFIDSHLILKTANEKSIEIIFISDIN